MPPLRDPLRQPETWALLLGLALIALPWRAHTDHGDAQLYQVVARHMVEDDTWLSLRYLPSVHPRFFEHLPFGLWPFALAIRLLGEGALAPLCAAFSAGTLLLTATVARRAAGPWAATVALLALALPDSFFVRAGHPFLEPPLLLLSTAAALPPLLGVPSWRGWLTAGLLAALACAVKGPFGLVPLVAATTARALVERSPRLLLAGAATTLAAATPTALFLALSPEWWEGYVRHQLLASALGERMDGRPDWYLPWLTAARRFWPGLPLALLGAVLATGRPACLAAALSPAGPAEPTRRAARVLLLTCLLALAALCLPSRKVWNHALVAFPLLAMLAGAAVGPWLQARLSAPERTRRATRALALVALAALGASATGAGRLIYRTSCVAVGPLAPTLEALPPGAPILVVSLQEEWSALSTLAVERRLVPWRLPALGAELPAGPASQARLALVAEGAPVSSASGWHEVGTHGRWRLLRR